MKNGRRPTIKQMNVMKDNAMNHHDWLVCKVLVDRLECVNRYTGTVKTAFYEVVS